VAKRLESSKPENDLRSKTAGSFRARIARVKRLLRNEQGGPAIEFALIMPALFLITFGALEMGLMLFNMATIEGALKDASRYGATGQSYGAPSMNRASAILSTFRSKVVGPVDVNSIVISTKVYQSFNDVRQPEPFTDINANGHYDAGEPYTDLNSNSQWDEDRGTAGAGNAGQIVEYRIDYDWKVLTPLLGPILAPKTDGKLPLSVSIVVRNEPFGGS